MSPANSCYSKNSSEKEGKFISGPRPAPLKINKESHLIHKNNNPNKPIPQQQTRQPVIIYSHSPKVIHTQARDFMALVQKLTGMSRSEPKETEQLVDDTGNNESNSGLTEEKLGGGGAAAGDFSGLEAKENSYSSANPMFNMANSYLEDIPLFTPNSADFFFSSSRPLFRCPDSVLPSPGLGASLSPSFFRLFRELPDK